jgi:hypothetical protein
MNYFKDEYFPAKSAKSGVFFLLGRITFVGGNSPFPIVGFFYKYSSNYAQCEREVNACFAPFPFPFLKETEFADFFFRAPGASPAALLGL